MSDLISRQAAIELAMQYCTDDDGSCSKADRDIRELLDDLENLPSAQPEQQWIPCSERLPEPDEEVFVYLWDNVPYITSMNGEGQWDTEYFCVDVKDAPKAWMPLPEPYKEERREE